MRLALAVAMLPCGDDQCRSRAVAKDPMPAGQVQLRIDDDPERVVSGTPPDRRAAGRRPVRCRAPTRTASASARMRWQCNRSASPVIQREFAVLGRNSAVEALPDMSDGEPAGVRKAIGKIEVELRRDIIRQRRRCTPPAIGGDTERAAIEWNRDQLRAGSRRERRARGEHGRPPERIARLAPSIRLSPGGIIPISEKSGGRPLVDWVRKTSSPDTPNPQRCRCGSPRTASASLALMREARSVFAGIGFALATMLLLVLG